LATLTLLTFLRVPTQSGPEPENEVGGMPDEELAKPGGVLIGQDDETHPLLGEEADQGRKPVDVPPVVDPAVAAVAVHEPAHAIAGRGDLRNVRRLPRRHMGKMHVL
jgi:hypothetical protein